METGKGNPWSAKDLRFSLGVVGAYSVPVGCKKAARVSGNVLERRGKRSGGRIPTTSSDVGSMLTRAGETVKQVGEGDSGAARNQQWVRHPQGLGSWAAGDDILRMHFFSSRPLHSPSGRTISRGSDWPIFRTVVRFQAP